MEILLRISCSPKFRHSTPSILILPPGSASRNKVAIRDDLPAPVLPTIPIYTHKYFIESANYVIKKTYTFSDGNIVAEIPLSTRGPSGK